MKEKETPLMKQYNLFKKKYPGALLLFRVGDFYETFGEDAVKASKILGIVLTRRNNGGTKDTELAGFPHHALETYLPKLVRAGERVAVCDQLEDPKFAKGLVKRGVTELVTPGVSFNDHVLEVKRNNYLCAVHSDKKLFGIAFLDVSTGEFFCTQGEQSYIDKLLQSLTPSEILYAKPKKQEFKEFFGEEYNLFYLDEWIFQYDFASNKLLDHFKIKTLQGLGIDHMPEGVVAAGVILQYLADTEHHQVSHIASLTRLEEDKYVWLDRFTIRNLELLFAQQEKGVPLIDILDKTLTPMGGRLLRKWLVLPLKNLERIQERLEMVEALYQDPDNFSALKQAFSRLGDLERLVSRATVGRMSPKELNQLKSALLVIPEVCEILDNLIKNASEERQIILKKYLAQFNPCSELVGKIDKGLREEATTLNSANRVIKQGLNAQLDELCKLLYEGKDYLQKILTQEIERTGITSLKIQFNKVFGYYIEVPNTHKNKVPTEWIRKQTLANAERYITEELKEYEEKILSAEEKILVLEQQLFQELINFTTQFVQPIQQNARALASIDCLASFAEISVKHQYARPKLDNSLRLDIKQGRHPVIERQLPVGEAYIPNDTFIDTESQQIIIITGPNMAGKSALLRQVALITLMAQIGCFVPASEAQIGLVDKIFTRVGASDNISKGESTFMVEMTETASIMNNLSERSLVIMDEIGRGTSTYDGISIAWSIVEFLHNHPKYKAKTLFATHYHELNQLEIQLPRVKNFNVSVKELEHKIVFLRKLQPGGSEHSFGIHVARMAGMPQGIVHRADEVLQTLEKEKFTKQNQQKLQALPAAAKEQQIPLFDAYHSEYEKVKSVLMKIDTNTLTPLEALMQLDALKKMAGF